MKTKYYIHCGDGSIFKEVDNKQYIFTDGKFIRWDHSVLGRMPDYLLHEAKEEYAKRILCIGLLTNTEIDFNSKNKEIRDLLNKPFEGASIEKRL